MAGTDYNSALTYHEATKHSEITLQTGAHYLDWDNKPAPFKEYTNLPSIALPRKFTQPGENALSAIIGDLRGPTPKHIDLEVLTEILFFTAGLTRKVRFGRDYYYMRAASATGALYPIELYVISGAVPGLEAGVYHFNPLHFSLVRLRNKDYRSTLVEAGSPGSRSAPLTLAFTSFAWRNAWKYEARSYRHWFWDSGVIAANLLATTNAIGVPTELVLGFVDSEIDKLLGLEAKREASVALAVVGQSGHDNAATMTQTLQRMDAHANRLSKEEVEYPIIWEINEASQLKSKSEAESWKKSLRSAKPADLKQGPVFPLQQLKEDPSPPLDQVILLRGSTRKFAHQAISLKHLSTIIQASATKIPLDFLPDNDTLISFYFIANDVSGLPSGSYFYNRSTNSVEQLKVLKNRSMSGYLCLGQQLFSDASAVFFLMTDLERDLGSLGNRGYRAVQFEAGVRAGKIYLSSYAVGIGASGSTFFDDAVTEFFSPHAKEKSPMIAVGIGVPDYKARPGKVLPQITT